MNTVEWMWLEVRWGESVFHHVYLDATILSPSYQLQIRVSEIAHSHCGNTHTNTRIHTHKLCTPAETPCKLQQYSPPPLRKKLIHTANYLLPNKAEPGTQIPHKQPCCLPETLQWPSRFSVSMCVCVRVSWILLFGALSKCVLVLHRPSPSVRHRSNQTTKATVNPLLVATHCWRTWRERACVWERWEERSACVQAPG